MRQRDEDGKMKTKENRKNSNWEAKNRAGVWERKMLERRRKKIQNIVM